MSRRTLYGLIGLLLIVAAIIWAISRNKKNNELTAAPLLSVAAYNQTIKAPATQIAASPNDIIVYILTAENQTDKVVSGYIIQANIADVTDKSTLIDSSGASYNSATNSLVWSPLDIKPLGVIQKQFIVRVNSPQAGSTKTVMKVKFNNELEVAIQPRPSRQVAGLNSFGAPVSGPAGDLSLWLASLTTAVIIGIKKYRSTK